jgi:hypothetical protein
VWVKALPEEHINRVLAQGDLRPMANDEEAMQDLNSSCRNVKLTIVRRIMYLIPQNEH